VALLRPDKRIPPQVRNGKKLNSEGSQATSNPPEDPTELTAHETQVGRNFNMKARAFCSFTSVSYKNTKSGRVKSKERLKEAAFRVPPTPLIFKDIQIITSP
jgi:hypothetical protein